MPTAGRAHEWVSGQSEGGKEGKERTGSSNGTGSEGSKSSESDRKLLAVVPSLGSPVVLEVAAPEDEVLFKNDSDVEGEPVTENELERREARYVSVVDSKCKGTDEVGDKP